MERALFDTNVILDIVLMRTPQFVAAARLSRSSRFVILRDGLGGLS